ncbi:MAG: hypothetical protein AMXMBFR6_01910 [Betaproteobacteria bacterium]
MSQSRDQTREIEVRAQDLPLHCPLPDAPLWARHPRVFLDVLATGEATCPYCGAHFRFVGDRPKPSH